MEMTRELEPWMPDAGCDDDHLASENNGPLVSVSWHHLCQFASGMHVSNLELCRLYLQSDGWSVEDMFAVNQDRFSIRSDYDEKLYHT